MNPNRACLEDPLEENHRARSNFVRRVVQRSGEPPDVPAGCLGTPPRRIVQFWDDLDQLPSDSNIHRLALQDFLNLLDIPVESLATWTKGIGGQTINLVGFLQAQVELDFQVMRRGQPAQHDMLSNFFCDIHGLSPIEVSLTISSAS